MDIKEIQLKPEIPVIGTVLGNSFTYYSLIVQDTSKMLTIV